MDLSDQGMCYVIKSVSYFLLVNTEPKGCIKLSRGLRQADRVSLKISHLFFANDNILFCHTTLDEVENIGDSIGL